MGFRSRSNLERDWILVVALSCSHLSELVARLSSEDHRDLVGMVSECYLFNVRIQNERTRLANHLTQFMRRADRCGPSRGSMSQLSLLGPMVAVYRDKLS
jgi:hypothetical protein